MLTTSPPRQILAIGAHPDDIEIGCGGTLRKILKQVPDCKVYWAVFSGDQVRAKEAESSAAELVHDRGVFECYGFQDGYFPVEWEEIKQQVRQIGKQIQPDLVFTHRLEDRHQDHRVLAELTWNEFRNQTVLEYEIPKYEGDLAANNLYCNLDRETCEAKVDGLIRHFTSQLEKPWFDEELFWGLLRLRGAESPEKSKYAEAFVCRKSTLQI